jgi:hypothetical protein
VTNDPKSLGCQLHAHGQDYIDSLDMGTTKCLRVAVLRLMWTRRNMGDIIWRTT